MEIGSSSQLGISVGSAEKANEQALKSENNEVKASNTQVSQDDAVTISAEAMAAYSASLNDGSGGATTNGTGVTPPPPPGGGGGTGTTN